MNEQSSDLSTTPGAAPSRLNRREAVKRGAMVTGAVGAAWTAPTIFDSFASPAAAGTCNNNTSPQTLTGTAGSPKPVCIPAGKTVTFTIVGGGGGAGSTNANNGGSATKIVGTFSTGATQQFLTLVGAAGGSGGKWAATEYGQGGAGGAGYRPGGDGADQGGALTTTSAGGGGGGGGAAAIYNASKSIYIVAQGGGGGAGGSFF